MPSRKISIPGVGPVHIHKRKGSRSVRLSIVGDGSVRVTQPRWLPYRVGEEFAQKKAKWIAKHQVPVKPLEDKQIIGKSFQLHFQADEAAKKPTARINGKHIIVKHQPSLISENDAVQQVADRAVVRALKKDSEDLLIPRLHALAQEHGFSFSSCQVKKMKGRWGSCSQHKDIVLNCYLVQLPWHLIDYVLLHELQHTEILAHGGEFWSALNRHVENLHDVRKEIKQHQARIA